MPTYCFRNNETGEVHEEMMKMDDRENYLKDHPELTQVLEMPQIVSGTDGLRKPDDSFRDCLLYTSPSPRDVEESRMPSSA